MDNKDQNEHLDGLPPKPPLWDELKDALDATGDDLFQNVNDQDESPSEHAQQVADFSSIKVGFVSNFERQEPPKFLWDTIEQDLEAQIETDAPTEFSRIKEGFVSAFSKQQPPPSLWAALVARVNHPEADVPVEEKATYSRIKNSFERKYSATVVPLFSWGDLVERMDAEAILADTPDHFSCIKDSFETVYTQQTPDAAVAENLWKRLYPWAPWWLVMQQAMRSPWAKRGLVALILLLGWSAWYGLTPLPDVGSLAEDTTNEVTLSTSDLLTTRKGAASEETVARQSEFNSSLRTKAPSTTREALMPFQLEQVASPTFSSPTSDALTIAVAPTSEEVNKVVITSEHTTQHISTAAVTNEAVSTSKAIEKSSSNTENQSENSTTNPANNLYTVDGSGSETTHIPPTTPTNILEQTRFWGSTLEETVANKISSKFSTNKINGLQTDALVPSLGTLDIQLVEEGWTALEEHTFGRNYLSNPAVARMEAKSFKEVRPTIRGRKMHFELGLEGRLGTSLLLGNLGVEQGDKKVVLCPAGAVGINFQYYMGINDALVLGASPYSSTTQCWTNKSETGRSEARVLRLSFVDFTIGYQRILLRYNGLTEVPASIYARVHVGMGWLTSSAFRVNQQRIHAPDLYANLNWSAGLSLGNLHQMQRFVLDYGLTSTMGLNRFVTDVQPSILQPARIVNLGAYVGLRYLFMPRKAPSKKQRQFDWSAPFYIEEPPF